MLREAPWTVVRGFLMGAADVVPGVSGGTIALVLGIYERLVAAIRAGSSALGHLLKGDVSGFGGWFRRVEWGFLLPLLGGIGLAVLTLARAIERGLEGFPVEMAALFLGLVCERPPLPALSFRQQHRRCGRSSGPVPSPSAP